MILHIIYKDLMINSGHSHQSSYCWNHHEVHACNTIMKPGYEYIIDDLEGGKSPCRPLHDCAGILPHSQASGMHAAMHICISHDSCLSPHQSKLYIVSVQIHMRIFMLSFKQSQAIMLDMPWMGQACAKSAAAHLHTEQQAYQQDVAGDVGGKKGQHDGTGS